MHYLYSIDLESYQSREIPKEIVKYSQDLQRSLFSSLRRYAKLSGLREKSVIRRVEKLLEEENMLFVFRPKNQIKGWIWVTPEGWIEDGYVFENYRDQNWGENLIYAALNEIDEKAEIVVDSRDIYLLQSLDAVLEKICCKVRISKVE